MVKQLVCILFFLWVSNSATAALITHNGYTLNEDTNIVTGGGLDWLQWDETTGMTIENIINDHNFDGWSVATETQVFSMYSNLFKFLSPSLTLDYASENANKMDTIIQLFGSTFQHSNHHPSYVYAGSLEYAQATYSTGTGYSGIGIYGEYTFTKSPIQIDPTSAYEEYGAHVTVGNDYNWHYNTVDPASGVVLVKDVNQVPEPSSLAIFALGIIGLASRRFKKSYR
jgi:hypothetical protein